MTGKVTARSEEPLITTSGGNPARVDVLFGILFISWQEIWLYYSTEDPAAF